MVKHLAIKLHRHWLKKTLATSVWFNLYAGVSLKLPIKPDSTSSGEFPKCLDDQREALSTPVYSVVTKGDLKVLVLTLLTSWRATLCEDFTRTGLSYMTDADREVTVKVTWNQQSKLKRIEVDKTFTKDNKKWVEKYVVQTKGQMTWMVGLQYSEDASTRQMAQEIYNSIAFLDREPEA